MLLRDFLFARPYQGSNLYLRPTTAGALSHYTNDLISAFPISELYRLHRDWSVQMKAHFNKDLYSLFSCLLQNTIKSICIVTNLYLRILLCIIINFFMVPQTGLEPVRRVRARDFHATPCHHGRFNNRCSLDSIFTICFRT